MNSMLERCLDQLPDFPIQFYLILNNILKTVYTIEESQDYNKLAGFLLDLANFMRQGPK